MGSTKKSDSITNSSNTNATGANKSVPITTEAQLASDQHIIPSNLITLCKELGQGEFGKVFQGVWSHSGTDKVGQIDLRIDSFLLNILSNF